MKESSIEKSYTRKVKKLGGWALKFIPFHVSGFPDRLTLLPGGIIRFAELKQNGEPLRKLQNVVCGRLRRLGFTVDRVDGLNIDEIIESYRDAIQSL